jgi:hypothetical protein
MSDETACEQTKLTAEQETYGNGGASRLKLYGTCALPVSLVSFMRSRHIRRPPGLTFYLRRFAR